MGPRKIRAFLLRLSPTLRDEAEVLAREEGISLNQFISLALAERIVRMEGSRLARREQQLAAGFGMAPKTGMRPAVSYSSVSLPLSRFAKETRGLRSENEPQRP